MFYNIILISHLLNKMTGNYQKIKWEKIGKNGESGKNGKNEQLRIKLKKILKSFFIRNLFIYKLNINKIRKILISI